MTRVGVAVVAARVCFTCGAQRVFSRPLGLWLYASRVTVDGLTAALVFFSVAMLPGRADALAIRALAIRARRARGGAGQAAPVPVPVAVPVPAGFR